MRDLVKITFRHCLQKYWIHGPATVAIYCVVFFIVQWMCFKHFCCGVVNKWRNFLRTNKANEIRIVDEQWPCNCDKLWFHSDCVWYEMTVNINYSEIAQDVQRANCAIQTFSQNRSVFTLKNWDIWLAKQLVTILSFGVDFSGLILAHMSMGWDDSLS